MKSILAESSAGLLLGEVPGLRLLPEGMRLPYSSPAFRFVLNAAGAPRPKLPRGTGTPPMLSKRAALSRTPANGVELLLEEYETGCKFDAEFCVEDVDGAPWPSRPRAAMRSLRDILISWPRFVLKVDNVR